MTSLPQSSSLVARFSADSLSLTNGANVTSWTDAAGGIVAATVVGTAPTFTTSRVGGKPSVNFGGAGGLTIATPGALATAIDSQDYTVIVVSRTLGTPPNGLGYVFGPFAPVSGWFINADDSDVVVFNSSSYGSIPFSGQSAAPFNSFGFTSFLTNQPNGSNGYGAFYINGGQVLSNSDSLQDSAGNTFGIGVDSGNNWQFNGEIFEILVWSNPLTPAEMLQAEMWICEKYSQSYPWAGLSAFNVFFGDSITAGFNASAADKRPAWLAASSLGRGFGQWSGCAVEGVNLSQMDTLAATWIDPIPALLGIPVNLVGFEFINTSVQTPGNDPAVVFAAANTYLGNRKAITNLRTVWGTSTSAAGFAGSDPVPGRATYDSDFDGAHPSTLISSYMSIHTDTHIGVDGSYATYSATTGGDGLHLTDTTYPYLATIFVNGINNVPNASAGAASGIGAQAGVGRATSISAGAASGTGAQGGVGRSTSASAGAAAGTGAAAGSGRATSAAAGSQAGTGAVAAAGRATAAAAGAAAGTGAASGQAATGASVGAAAGAAAAAAAGQSTAAAIGVASGTGAAIATGQSKSAAMGAAAGAGSVSGNGLSTAAAAGAAAGTGAASAISLTGTIGAAAGIGAAAAVGRSNSVAAGSAAGSGAAGSVGAAAAQAAAAAAGTGAAAAIGTGIRLAVGAAVGSSLAAGAGQVIANSIGAAAGAGAALGLVASGQSTATASGIGAATGVGRAIVLGLGAASGRGAAAGFPNSVFMPSARFAAALSENRRVHPLSAARRVGVAS